MLKRRIDALLTTQKNRDYIKNAPLAEIANYLLYDDGGNLG
jgi:hypothetical protein